MSYRLPGEDETRPAPYLVGMFDVLGFGNLVRTLPLDELARHYRVLQQIKQFVPDAVRTTIFSDTILLWARADNPSAVELFFAACGSLIPNALEQKWSLRGGIAYGECVLDLTNRIFVGQPIVDANQTEGSQEWVGAALHESCHAHPFVGDRIGATYDVCRYDVPVKEGRPQPQFAIDWPRDAYNAIGLLNAARNAHPPSKNDAAKYLNAEAFVRACAERHAALLRST